MEPHELVRNVHTSSWVTGDEYTQLLNAYRPIPHGDGDPMQSTEWSTWVTIETLVNDARRYRTRVAIAEEEASVLRQELSAMEQRVIEACSGLGSIINDSIDPDGL